MNATVLDVTCNHCGAPLALSESVRFVTCEHCGSRLEVRREGGAAYTEVLERVDRLEEATDALGDDLARTKIELALTRLDEAWKQTLDTRRWRGPQGQEMRPNVGTLRALGVMFAISGLGLLVWCLFLGLDIGGSVILVFGLFGLFFGGGFVWLGVYLYRKGPQLAAAYDEARAEYVRQRAELEQQLARRQG